MKDVIGSLGTKTGKMGIAAILTAIAGYITGDLSWIQAIFAGLAGLGTITARAAIEKSGPIDIVRNPMGG